MKRKYEILIITACCIIFLLGSFGIIELAMNAENRKNQKEIQQKEYKEAVDTLYNKYEGCRYSKEDDRLYFKLYANEAGQICISYTSLTKDGEITETFLQDVRLVDGCYPGTEDGYLRAYFSIADSEGWEDFLIFENDETKLSHGDTVYCKE